MLKKINSDTDQIHNSNNDDDDHHHEHDVRVNTNAFGAASGEVEMGNKEGFSENDDDDVMSNEKRTIEGVEHNVTDLNDKNVEEVQVQVQVQEEIQAQHDQGSNIHQMVTTSGDSFAQNVKNNAYLSESIEIDEIIDHMKTNNGDAI